MVLVCIIWLTSLFLVTIPFAPRPPLRSYPYLVNWLHLGRLSSPREQKRSHVAPERTEECLVPSAADAVRVGAPDEVERLGWSVCVFAR